MESLREPGTVIVLNGPSVSGKSSIQKALQASFVEPYLAMGIDSILVAMMPPRYFVPPYPADSAEFMSAEATHDAEGRPLFSVRFGPRGRSVVSGMHHAIAAFARQGNNVLVDHIFYEPDWAGDLAEVLDGLRAYLVGVRIPLEVLEERERQRSTSPVGHARSHYDTVHAHGAYDLEVDTSRLTPAECAARVREHVEQHPPRAFALLRRRS
jgi:chloramphenicol 3-O phosphotransferase